MMPMKPVILWFRRNLRLNDNAALEAAAESGRPVIPVYVIDGQDRGGASRWWLHGSLTSLDHGLNALGGRLVVRAGEPEQVLPKLVAETGAECVAFARRHEPAARRQEAALAEALPDGVGIDVHDDALLVRPDSLLTGSGTPYRVFTPFWRAAQALGEPPQPCRAPASVRFARHGLEMPAIAGFELLPARPDWAGGLRRTWQPGETGAALRLEALAESVADYAAERDRPDLDTTSRLSPHLAFGEISVRQVWHALRSLETQQRSTKGPEALLRQLFWRDFSSYLLHHFPTLPDEPLRAGFEFFPWRRDAGDLSAWQRGRTGYPIVDAGMRQLRETGWMHNRVRMIVASFLVKNLLIPWQDGADWFLDTLVDADLANNSASWQWVAGCGTDAAPYFRIFNPVLQGRKFDPQGRYVRRWVPELAGVPDAAVHEPRPDAIVDHGAARKRALEAYESTRGIRASNDAP